jgi:hypothetical protein
MGDMGTDNVDRIDALGKQFQNHCPHHCQNSDLDEYGYCEHLLGFTSDGETYEKVSPLVRKSFITKEDYDTGMKVTRGPKKGEKPLRVPGNAVLVNPEVEQTHNGAKMKVKAWVSSRVYVSQGEARRMAEEKRKAREADQQETQLERELAAEEAKQTEAVS